MLKIVGAVLVAAAGIFVSRLYSGYLVRRCDEGEAFLRLIEHISGEISRYLTPPAELLKGYSDKVLDSLGFTDTARSEGFAAAFSSVRKKCALSEETAEILGKLFSGFGRDYKSGELARLDEAKTALSRAVTREREELSKNLKLGRVLIGAAALGIIILLL